MSRLRRQLQSATDAYRQLHYPGDLGTEILGSETSRRRGAWLLPVGFGGGALAAAVTLLVILPRLSAPRSHHPPIARSDGPAPAVIARPSVKALAALTPPAMPALPAMPDWSAVPALPAMPALPSMPMMSLADSAPAVRPDRTERPVGPAETLLPSPGWVGFPSLPGVATPPAGDGHGGRGSRGGGTTKESI